MNDHKVHRSSNPASTPDPAPDHPSLFGAADAQETGVPVFRVELVQERTFDAPVVTGPADVAPLVCQYLRGADREHFVVVLLATNGKVIGIHTAHIGSLTASIASTREVFKVALLANAAAIVVAHCHPSGNLEPSREDVRVSRRLVAAGELMEVAVHDSLIVGLEGTYTSLAERGLLSQ
jgi:DNA repair protein RadC